MDEETVQSYVLYTYKTVNGEVECHAYGLTDQASAQAEGEKLQAADPTVGFMVLPLEAMPS